MSLIRIDPPHTCGSGISNHNTAIGSQRGETTSVSKCIPLDERDAAPLISVVIPAKNEAGNLPSLLAEVTETFGQLYYLDVVAEVLDLVTFEVIVVDDGSTDESHQVLDTLARKYTWLQPLYLSSSIGQSGCLIAGIRQARGAWIATLDADLQNHPADLKVLWEALTGYDAALGWRVKRADPCSKRVTSWIANWVRNLVLGQAIRDTGCAVRIFPRTLALRLPAFQGMHRFVGPLLLREGCCIVQVPVRHRPRVHGRSHYTFWNRSWNVLIDLLGVMWLMHRPVTYDQYEEHLPACAAQRVRKPTSAYHLHSSSGKRPEEMAQPKVTSAC